MHKQDSADVFSHIRNTLFGLGEDGVWVERAGSQTADEAIDLPAVMTFCVDGNTYMYQQLSKPSR